MITKNSFISYWLSNRDWWRYDDKGNPTLLPSAPPKAKDSYKEYLKHQKDMKKVFEEPIIIDE